jgi:two-component system chemotaxis sensor kinase CheA
MAIVREKIEKVGGSIDVEAAESGGTRFRIVLPATLATFRGVLVDVSGREFVLPSLNVEGVRRLARAAGEPLPHAIDVNGAILPLRHLGEILRIASKVGVAEATHWQVVVLAGGGTRVAVCVDDIVGDQEIVVKGLGPQLVRVPNVAAVTLLDGGRVAPILNVQDVMKSVLSQGRRPAAGSGKARLQSLLVVEDSATSRILLRNILEAAGYVVATAADGADALVALDEGHFDLVVSDIEMPRMDGFTLTARIRADRQRHLLPVVLVTTLDSPDSRERGLAAGANAYIVKGGFDQSDLLEAIRRLI